MARTWQRMGPEHKPRSLKPEPNLLISTLHYVNRFSILFFSPWACPELGLLSAKESGSQNWITHLSGRGKLFEDEMNNEWPIGRETQCKKEMAHKGLEDLTLFPFVKGAEGTLEGISCNSLFEQRRRGEVTFSESQHCFSGTKVKALFMYSTVVSITLALLLLLVELPQ